jgi:hypothetical protein
LRRPVEYWLELSIRPDLSGRALRAISTPAARAHKYRLRPTLNRRPPPFLTTAPSWSNAGAPGRPTINSARNTAWSIPSGERWVRAYGAGAPDEGGGVRLFGTIEDISGNA